MENIPKYLEIEGTVLTRVKKGCTIKNIAIPEGITKIGQWAFSRCWKTLTNVDIPESVKEIGDYAFLGCHLLANLTIPASVTKIGESAFFGCDALTKVVIPKSVTEIGEQAFGNCEALASITISESVTKIGYCTFSDCTSLASITIPKSVTEIDKSAFWGCTALTSVVIPASVKKMGDNRNGVFNCCKNLKTVQYEGTLAQWCEMYNDHPLMDNTEKILLADGTDIRKLTELVIPESVTKIGESAFLGCKALTSVMIHEGVTKIGEWAFKKCENLKMARYGGTLAQWCAVENDTYLMSTERILLGDGTDVKALTELVIPEGVTKIGCNAFSGCKKLTSITIPDSVTEIGNEAFSNCEGLTGTIKIPGSVKKIGWGAFHECEIDTIQYDGTLEDWCANEYNNCFNCANHVIMGDGTDLKALTTIEFREGTKIIDNVTASEELITSITIPASVTKIVDWAFLEYNNLKTVRYGGTLAQWCAMENDSPIMEYAESVLLGDGTDIKKLTAVEIPEGMTKIGPNSFWKCGELTSVIIPESVTEIGRGAFGKCDKLKSIDIPKGVTLINENTFLDCHELASMTIPESVEIIMFNAFGACLKLKDVRYGGTKEQWRNIMSQDSCLDNKVIHCSDGDIKEKYSICP